MSDNTREFHLSSPEQTTALAHALAPRLRSGDVILLSGPVGAGKSHFARSLILALLDTPEDVPSPTYTLVQTYPGRSGEIWHSDLYRLSDTSEVEELGLLDAFDNAICLVEWPDRLGDLAPSTALTLDFAPGLDEETRHLALSWSDPRWTARLEDLSGE